MSGWAIPSPDFGERAADAGTSYDASDACQVTGS